MANHSLPGKLISYLRRLELEYTLRQANLLVEVITSGKYFVVEETEYDGWNGGTYGHDVIAFVPTTLMAKISIKTQKEICKEVCEHLNEIKSDPNEFFSEVRLEINDESDARYMQALPFSNRPRINADNLGIWKSGYVRLFVSHRDKHRVEAKRLSIALEGYGISAFVAHDTIEPMTTWQSEILKGLETMEVMLVFVTDDFAESTWTNQEIGFALGRGIPIIPLKLETSDPAGFVSSVQALKGRLADADDTAPMICELIGGKLRQRQRLQQAMISAFIDSPNYDETKLRFDRLNHSITKITGEELALVIEGFRSNDQLYNAQHLISRYERLRVFLARTTNKNFEIRGREIVEIGDDLDDEIPF